MSKAKPSLIKACLEKEDTKVSADHRNRISDSECGRRWAARAHDD